MVMEWTTKEMHRPTAQVNNAHDFVCLKGGCRSGQHLRLISSAQTLSKIDDRRRTLLIRLA